MSNIIETTIYQCSGLRTVGTNLEDGVLYETNVS